MSLDLEARLRMVLASAPPAIREIRTLEISHSAMSQSWCLWREPYAGSITTEDGVRAVLCANLDIKLPGSEGNLDQNITINIDTTQVGDTELRGELDSIPLDTREKIQCVYRAYLSDDLDSIVTGPSVLQVATCVYRVGAATISASLPRYNVTRTGELYVSRDVPMLRGFL